MGVSIVNYEVIYAKLVETRKNRELDPNEYYEKHHIWPKSLNGTDEKWNIVYFTAREHFVAHWLLYKICEGKDKIKMGYALFRMCWNPKEGQIIFGRKYEMAKKARSESMSGENNHNKLTENKIKISKTLKKRYKEIDHPTKGKSPWNKGLEFPERSGENHPMYGVKHSEETKDKISNSLKGTTAWNKGKSWDEETRKKIGEAGKGRIPWNKGKEWEKIECEYCKKKVSIPMYSRWHGENCGKKIKKYKVYDPQGNEYITEEGIGEFCKKYNLTVTNMIAVIKGKRKQHKGWTIKKNYIEEEG